MLSFLRKIRKSIIESGSVKKYVLYAIGEIALVVIGILIALQINNWNEGRKDKIKEIKVLEQLAKTLESNALHFTSTIESIKKHYDRAEKVISIVEEKRPYDESMNELFHSVRVIKRLTLTTAGYEELKNTGFDIIQSDSLKESIVNLFESNYSETQKILDEVDLYGDNFREFIIDSFLEIEYDMLRPVNYEMILNSHFYYSSLLHMRSIRYWRMKLIEKSQKENNKVLQFIRNELSLNKMDM